jgi:hypothetical protein
MAQLSWQGHLVLIVDRFLLSQIFWGDWDHCAVAGNHFIYRISTLRHASEKNAGGLEIVHDSIRYVIHGKGA